jgi:sulfotransferase
VFTRVDHLTSKLGTVGFAWNAVQEAFYGEHAHDRLILLDYEALTREPQRTMARLYELLGFSPFEHDFENVSYEGGGEFDVWLGVPGLHTIAQKVEYVPRKSILPPELVGRFANQCFWRNREDNPSGVAVLTPQDPPSTAK